MNNKIISTIEKYPGTILETLGVSEDVLSSILPLTSLIPVNEEVPYAKVYEMFINELKPLRDIPELLGFEERQVSAFAGDIIGTLQNFVSESMRVSRKSSDQFDIYEYAEEVNADYYCHKTGNIYHIQEYNRARKFGLPTPGIRVSYNGETIGYAQRLE